MTTSRTDRTTLPHQHRLVRAADAVMSTATGLGVPGEDKAVDARPSAPAWMDAPTLEWASIDGFLHRMVHAIPEEALALGWRTDDAATATRDATADVDVGLDLEATILDAAVASRTYGGCYSLLIREGVERLDQPAPPPESGRLLRVQPLMAAECLPLTWDNDPRSATWSKPLTLQVTMMRPGISQFFGAVHRSHLVYMPGLPMRPTTNPGLLGYDLPVPVAYWDAVRDLGLAHRSAAVAAMEQSMLWLQMQGGAALQAGDDEDRVRDALELWTRSRSTLRANVTVGDDTLSRLEAPLSGLDGILRASYDRVAAIEGVPLVWLLGQPPGGMTSDDQASRRAVSRLLNRWRRTRAAPWLRAVYRYAVPDVRPTIVWPDVDPPTETERAQVSLIRAQRDTILRDLGVVGPDEIRARFDADEEIDLPVLLDDVGDDTGL